MSLEYLKAKILSDKTAKKKYDKLTPEFKKAVKKIKKDRG